MRDEQGPRGGLQGLFDDGRVDDAGSRDAAGDPNNLVDQSADRKGSDAQAAAQLPQA